MKSDVVWALQQMTITESEPEGQVFKTSKQARDWINDHERELGIR